MAEYSPEDWSRPKPAIDRIFDRMCSLRLNHDLADVADTQPGFARYREVAGFERYVEMFHRRMSRSILTGEEASRRRRFHVAHESAREGETDYAFYNLPELPVSFMTYSAVNSLGQIVVGERLTVFDAPDNPFLATAVLTRANYHVPGNTRGVLVPTDITVASPRKLYDIDTKLAQAEIQLSTPLRAVEPIEA
ncbi:MAG TPA: hypothetical protein VGE30_03605 [Candidatus Saccharimonadales bacterium]